MFEKVDNLENMIERVSGVIQSLRNDKDQLAEELEVVREVLDEKEKEVSSLREERGLLEQRLSGLLDKLKSNYELCDDGFGKDDASSSSDDIEASVEREETFQGGHEVRQGELTDRF